MYAAARKGELFPYDFAGSEDCEALYYIGVGDQGALDGSHFDGWVGMVCAGSTVRFSIVSSIPAY